MAPLQLVSSGPCELLRTHHYLQYVSFYQTPRSELSTSPCRNRKLGQHMWTQTARESPRPLSVWSVSDSQLFTAAGLMLSVDAQVGRLRRRLPRRGLRRHRRRSGPTPAPRRPLAPLRRARACKHTRRSSSCRKARCSAACDQGSRHGTVRSFGPLILTHSGSFWHTRLRPRGRTPREGRHHPRAAGAHAWTCAVLASSLARSSTHGPHEQGRRKGGGGRLHAQP
jgi:hypothetical protein